MDILPDLPGWALGALAGCMGFVIVIATVLLLAQFPAAFTWVRRVGRRRPPGLGRGRGQRYERVAVGSEMEDFHPGAGRSCRDGGLGRRSGSSFDGGVKMRSGKGKGKGKSGLLKIDTACEYFGLGIAVPGHQCTDGREVDEGDVELRNRRTSPLTARSAYLSSPLPSMATLPRGHPTSNTNSPRKSPLSTASSDIESGNLQPSPLRARSLGLFDMNSLVHEELPSPELDPAPGSAFLERINEGVRDAADRLSRTFYDQVTAREEGLLLPVREDERERAMVPGVLVG